MLASVATTTPLRWQPCVRNGRSHHSTPRTSLKCKSSSSNHALYLPGHNGGKPSIVSRWTSTLRDFLREQAAEFRKIEWPSFESTAKTSFFVIFLSFLLIIALTSLDTGYAFVLSKFVK